MIDGVVVHHGNPLLLSPKRMPTINRRSLAATASGVQTSGS